MGDINLFVRSVFVFFIFVFLISSPVFAFYDDDSFFAGNVFLDSLVFSSSSTTVDLVLDDVVIGHELLWRASTTGTNYEESAVAYVDGVAYIGSCSTHGDGYDMLFAVDTSNGEILWSKFTGPGYVGPVIDDDVVYFGTDSHGLNPGNEYMFAIDRHTGEEIWKVKIYNGIPESVQYDDYKIYFCSDKVYGLNKIDGSVNWTYNIGSLCVTKPMLMDDVLYAASSGGRLVKIDTTDGNPIWSIVLPAGPWDNSITSDSLGHLYLACYYSNAIYCFDEFDGSLIWSYELRGGSLSFNAYHDGVVFISDVYGFVYALDAVSGDLIWENHVAGTFDISSPTISGGLVVIGSRDFNSGAFYVLDEKTGELLWKYTVGASITAPPSIADGMMLCGTDGWDLYCFDFGIGDDDWLLHRYDSLNTAYSPGGLTEWQYVQADCSIVEDVVSCRITNFYDHSVSNIILNLWSDYEGYWYDSLGNMISSTSDSYTIDVLESGSELVLFISEAPVSAPLKPEVPEGPDSGKVGVEYTYTSSCEDPDGDDLFYLWDWGDGNFSDWIGPYKSGDITSATHSWDNQNTYQVKVRTKDTKGLLSEWSDLFDISMPKEKLSFDFSYLFFKIISMKLKFIRNGVL
jgi:outer membrane protein assembly factor BamB